MSRAAPIERAIAERLARKSDPPYKILKSWGSPKRFRALAHLGVSECEHCMRKACSRFQLNRFLTLLDSLRHSSGKVVDPKRFVAAFERQRVEKIRLLYPGDCFIEMPQRAQI